MEFENLIQLIQTVSDSQLTKLSYEENGVRLELKKEKEQVQALWTDGMAFRELHQAAGDGRAVSEKNGQSQATEEQGSISEKVVKSPLVGTFYAAAAPGEAPFVQVGDSVKKGQVLGIVEAMKLMNEIESEYDGVVKEILVSNEDMIEFGQPMFVIE